MIMRQGCLLIVPGFFTTRGGFSSEFSLSTVTRTESGIGNTYGATRTHSHQNEPQVDKTAQNSGSSATRVAFHPGDHGFFTTSGAQHLRLWYTSSDNVLKAHGILPQAKEQARKRRLPMSCYFCVIPVEYLYLCAFDCVV